MVFNEKVSKLAGNLRAPMKFRYKEKNIKQVTSTLNLLLKSHSYVYTKTVCPKYLHALNLFG